MCLFGEKVDDLKLSFLVVTQHKFYRPQEAIATLETLDLKNPRGDFQRVEAVIDYNNGDSIRATFQNKLLLAEFLHTLGNE